MRPSWQHWGLITIASLVLFLSSLDWPFWTEVMHPEAAWIEVLHHAFLQRWQWGRDIIFTFGPLGFLMTGEYVPGTFPYIVAWNLVVHGLGVYISTYYAFQMHSPRAVVVFLCVLGVNASFGTACGRDCILFAHLWMISCGYLLSGSRNASIPLLVIVICGVLALIKFTFIPFFLFLGFAFVLHAWTRQQRALAMILTAVAALLPAALWLACGQSFSHVPAYLSWSAETSQAYSVAMSLFDRKYEVVCAVLSGLGLVGLVVLTLKDPGPKLPKLLVAGITGLTTFIVWKHGFVRHDDHCLLFLAVVPCLASLAWMSQSERPARTAIKSLIAFAIMGSCLCCAFWRMAFISGFALTPADLLFKSAERIATNVDTFMHLPARMAQVSQKRSAAISAVRIPALCERVGREPVAWFTNSASLPIVSGLNLYPRGAVMSYAAYTERLVQADLAFMTAASRPRFAAVKIEAPDNRYLMSDDGPCLLELLKAYRPVANYGGIVLFERPDDTNAGENSTAHANPQTSEIVMERECNFGEVLPIDAEPSAWHAVSIDVRLSRWGRLLRTTAKVPAPQLHLQLQDGTVRQFRLIPDLCKSWFLIDPVVLGTGDFAQLAAGVLQQPLKNFWIHVAPEDRGCFESKITIRLRRVVPPSPLTGSRRDSFLYPGLFASPSNVKSSIHEMRNYLGHPVYVLSAPGTAHLAIPPGTRKIRGKFGQIMTPPPAGHKGPPPNPQLKATGLVFTVTHVGQRGEQVVLFRKPINPWANAEDQKEQAFELSLEGLEGGWIKLTTDAISTSTDGCYFRDLFAE